MMPGMNPRQVEQAMRKLGVKQLKIDARRVIIETSDKRLIINNPEVIKINMMGNESLQITGTIEEESNITEDDVNTVANQANVSNDQAKKALENSKGDLAAAIIELQNK